MARTLRPLVGVRAIADAAGLDRSDVVAMMRSGNLGRLSGRLIGRQIQQAAPNHPAVDWSHLIQSIDEIT